jgi:hypothetical protein
VDDPNTLAENGGEAFSRGDVGSWDGVLNSPSGGRARLAAAQPSVPGSRVLALYLYPFAICQPSGHRRLNEALGYVANHPGVTDDERRDRPAPRAGVARSVRRRPSNGTVAGPRTAARRQAGSRARSSRSSRAGSPMSS